MYPLLTAALSAISSAFHFASRGLLALSTGPVYLLASLLSTARTSLWVIGANSFVFS